MCGRGRGRGRGHVQDEVQLLPRISSWNKTTAMKLQQEKATVNKITE